MDAYQKLIVFEEKQAQERSLDKDSENFFLTCNVIRNCMAEISKVKAAGGDDVNEKITELRIEAAMAFLELKKLNRMEKFRTKAARDELITAKTNVDSKHLQLQNLLYEVDHLKKEVTKCLLFRSRDETIDLVSEEEFYKNAPATISRPEDTQNDPHQRRLARLEYELMQRKELSEECDKLGDTIKSVETEIESKRARLDNLNPQLKAILDASKPLQESLGLPLDKIKVEHEKASFLPSHLYIIYAKATAFKDACDATLVVSVEGDEEEARRINGVEIIQDSDSDNEGSQENASEEPPVHKKRHNKISKEARQEEKKIKYLQRHPLSVKIVVSFKDDTKMKLQFFWMSYFKIITVESDLLTVNLGGISVGDMLVPESVLRELYPGDIAAESPNPANIYQISQCKMQPFTSLSLGLPYKWAQKLGGLNFIPTEPKDQKSITKNLGQDQIENVIKQIKNRVKARLELCSEIQQLESGNLVVTVSDIDPIPQKASSILHKFVISSWKNYCSAFNHLDAQNEFITSSDVFYEAVLRRGNSDLVVFIAIKPDYPRVPAILRIKMAPSIGCPLDTCREIEREVNVMWEKPPLLSAQLQRLKACFDIYLETENLATKEKIFFQQCRGRTRSRPFKYVEIGGGIFTQR